MPRSEASLGQWLTGQGCPVYLWAALGLISDAGISSALIQRDGRLTSRDERAAFTLQLLLAAVAVAMAAPLARLYTLGDEHAWALRPLAALSACFPGSAAAGKRRPGATCLAGAGGGNPTSCL